MLILYNGFDVNIYFSDICPRCNGLVVRAEAGEPRGPGSIPAQTKLFFSPEA